nr:immunoglobulin heavy chain junction region [Mus musculus]
CARRYDGYCYAMDYW